jgi:3-deoxy-D-manno-octulosonic acid (KDO) 8-phosphate synthase
MGWLLSMKRKTRGMRTMKSSDWMVGDSPLGVFLELNATESEKSQQNTCRTFDQLSVPSIERDLLSQTFVSSFDRSNRDSVHIVRQVQKDPEQHQLRIS